MYASQFPIVLNSGLLVFSGITMQIGKLDHVNVRTHQLEKMIDWYTRILGMQQGYRPEFPFPGAWMYAGDTPSVHLVSVDDDSSIGSEAKLKLEHFAFTATGAAEFEVKLKQLAEPYRLGGLASESLIQYNVWDPDGNHIHIDFHSDE